MTQMIHITLPDGLNKELLPGTTVQALWTGLTKEEKPVNMEPVGAVLNRGIFLMVQEAIPADGTLTWVDRRSTDGYHIYRQSVLFMLIKACRDLFPERRLMIQHTISNGVFCEFEGMKSDAGELERLEQYMKEFVAADIPFRIFPMRAAEAAEILAQQKQEETAAFLRMYPEKEVKLFEMDGYYEYFVYPIINQTKWLRHFHLFPYENGFVVQTPEENSGQLEEFREQKKLQCILQEAVVWKHIAQVSNLSQLNQVIADGKADELIRISEALQEKRIAKIADTICENEKVRLVLIAGPSSSGKTSFAQRLSIQLRVNGKKTMTISMDNYFVNRDQTPKDENGEYDFENLDALDVELFNQHLVQLLQGESVQLPIYDFVRGERSSSGPVVQLEPDQLLVIEGIHGLNEKLTFRVPREQKRVVYISALTELNLDDSNPILTSDARLLRRIARDSRTRGHGVRETIKRWPSVRRGEKKNIFAYQENADLFFNSELLYELAVLKPIVAPLLASIQQTEPEYEQAQRLLRFLDFVLAIENPRVPYQSLMREFIGGSWFEVE